MPQRPDEPTTLLTRLDLKNDARRFVDAMDRFPAMEEHVLVALVLFHSDQDPDFESTSFSCELRAFVERNVYQKQYDYDRAPNNVLELIDKLITRIARKKLGSSAGFVGRRTLFEQS